MYLLGTVLSALPTLIPLIFTFQTHAVIVPILQIHTDESDERKQLWVKVIIGKMVEPGF